MSHIKISRRQQFLSIEQSFLTPLPVEDYEIRRYKRATVQKMDLEEHPPDFSIHQIAEHENIGGANYYK